MKRYDDVIALLPDGVRLTVKARPGLAKARSIKLVDLSEDKRAIEITVSAAAQDGQANKAIVNQLAQIFEVKKKDIMLKTGQTCRLKSFDVKGNPIKLCAQMAALLAASS